MDIEKECNKRPLLAWEQFMRDIQYKPADDTDIEPVFEFSKALIEAYENTEAIDYPKALLWVRKKIETHIREYCCVYLGEKKIGYYYFHQSDGKMELDDLYILPQYRGMGIGTEILQKCLAETNLPVFLYVFVNNQRAVALYKRLGFRVTEQIKDSRYLMQRG
ncbi:MAG: GNAT family N-acetyltransferase [Eubacteriales bacterium]|nr:GNAT family N-acetyltransferase [Eubacteriales bacterium]